MPLEQLLVGPDLDHAEMIGAADLLQYLETPVALILAAGVSHLAQRRHGVVGAWRNDVDVRYGVDDAARRRRDRRQHGETRVRALVIGARLQRLEPVA